MFPESLDGVRCNRDPQEFAGRRFELKRSSINYLHLAAFRSRWVNRLFYDSPFADPLHEVLWFVRRHPWIEKVLYGKHGPGEARRGGAVLREHRR